MWHHSYVESNFHLLSFISCFKVTLYSFFVVYLLQVTTKDIIAQQVITHEAIYKIAKLLDQFCEGLKKLHIMQLIRSFPELFAPLLTYTGDISPDAVLEAIFIKDETELHSEDKVLLSFLQTFIQTCTQGGSFSDIEW